MERSKRYWAVVRSLRANKLWLPGIALMFVWWVCLLLKTDASFASFMVLNLFAAAVLGLLLSLSNRNRWKLITLLFLGGLALRGIEILFIQTLPQASDAQPDSILYDLNARALADHWGGLRVGAEDYKLQGLIQQRQDWLPTDWLSYATVFGSRHFLYQVYVGVIYSLTGPQSLTVTLSHTVLLAALAPVAYGLSNLLFENERIAILAAALTLIDPSFAVAGAFLWKDSLIAFLMGVALWTTVPVVRRQGARYPMTVLIAALLGLSVLRYPVLMGFWLAAVFVMVWAYNRSRAKRLLVVLVLSFLGSMVLYSPPELLRGLEGLLVTTPVSTVQGGIDTLQAAPDAPSAYDETDSLQAAPDAPSAYDETTGNWVQSLRENPPLAITKTVAHTLFAPYPWVPLFNGLNYESFTELLYPGTLMWSLGLPFLFVALWRLPIRGSPELLLIAIWLLLVVFVYIVFQGEFSTRQRVFMMPLFWMLIAFGLEQARAYLIKRRQQDI